MATYDEMMRAAKQQALWQGLMGLGGQMLQGGDPRQPQGFGASLGRGVQGFGQGYQNAFASQLQNEMARMQMAQMERQTARENSQQGAMVTLTGGLDPNTGINWNTGREGMSPQQEMGLLAQASPETALSRMFPEPQKPMAVAPGAALVDPSTGQPIYQAPEAAPAGFVRGPDGKLQADPGYMDAQMRLRMAGRPQTNVNLPPQQTKEAEKVGEYYAETFVNSQNAARDSQSRADRIGRVNSLLANVYTGTGGDTVLEIKKSARALGIDLGSADIGKTEAAAALANEMALQLRNPAGGAGMPGAMSDKDREFLTNMTPNLTKTPEGRKVMEETARRTAKRDAEVAKMAREYRARFGRLDEGFLQSVQDYAMENPLFEGLTVPDMSAAPDMPNIDALLQKYGG